MMLTRAVRSARAAAAAEARSLTRRALSGPPPSPGGLMPLIERAQGFADRDAVVGRDGSFHTYDDLLERSAALAAALQARLGQPNLQGARVGVLCTPGQDYVAAQWAVWRSGGCFVPLCVTHPQAELEYVINDCGIDLVIADRDFLATVQKLPVPALPVQEQADGFSAAAWQAEMPAMIVYTSGTTGRPKGVVTRHSALHAQVTDQYSAWGWTQNDRLLNCLPLHHVHGIVNCTVTPHYAGACVEFMAPDPERIWQRFRMGPIVGGALTLFMAVPTIYSRLISAYDQMSEKDRQTATLGARDLRLMVSGSAALPTTVMQRWKEITGHTLLERYGMTEFAMGLTNPLHPVEDRLPGYVGNPMPSVEVKLVDEATGDRLDPTSGESGQLFVRGPVVFQEYWNKPEATAKEFDAEGWFKTGDVAAYDPEKKSYRILGRASADIIKSGGYKISALEIERVALENPHIAEIAVLGIQDEEFGERVAAVLVPKAGTDFDEAEFKTWAKDRLAKYKIPRVYKVVDSIPKNAMGKVSKVDLRKTLF